MAGAVVPYVGIVTKHTGTPASANTSAASMPSLSLMSGCTVPMRLLIGGRRRSCSAPPAITVAISTAYRASRSPCTMPCRCLAVLFQAASSSCRVWVSPQSAAATLGHQNCTEPR